jgi:hypothetical protein
MLLNERATHVAVLGALLDDGHVVVDLKVVDVVVVVDD